METGEEITGHFHGLSHVVFWIMTKMWCRFSHRGTGDLPHILDAQKWNYSIRRNRSLKKMSSGIPFIVHLKNFLPNVGLAELHIHFNLPNLFYPMLGLPDVLFLEMSSFVCVSVLLCPFFLKKKQQTYENVLFGVWKTRNIPN